MPKTETLDLCKVVTPDACKLLGGETQRKIIDRLRAKELSVCDISKELNVTPQAIYHHIKKLENAGLISVTREERCGHLIESYYKTTAENFICSTEEIKGEPLKEDLAAVLSDLNKIGFKLEVTEEKMSELTEILAKQKKFEKLPSPALEICRKCGSTEFFVKFGPMDLVKLDHTYHYANLIMMTDEEYEEKINLERELRQFLISICTEKPKT